MLVRSKYIANYSGGGWAVGAPSQVEARIQGWHRKYQQSIFAKSSILGGIVMNRESRAIHRHASEASAHLHTIAAVKGEWMPAKFSHSLTLPVIRKDPRRQSSGLP